MQQRQLRLGDILDDYCPRERRVTNHAVVAMVGADVKQTRCTTCDAEHEYKHAKVPRQRERRKRPPRCTRRCSRAVRSASCTSRQSARRRRAPRRRAGRGPWPRRRPSATRRMPTNLPRPTGEEAGAGRPTLDGRERRWTAKTKRRGPGASAADSRDAAAPGRASRRRAPAPGIHHSPAGRAVPNRFRPRTSAAGQPFQGNRSNGDGHGGGGPMRGGRPRQGGRRPPQGAR